MGRLVERISSCIMKWLIGFSRYVVYSIFILSSLIEINKMMSSVPVNCEQFMQGPC